MQEKRQAPVLPTEILVGLILLLNAVVRIRPLMEHQAFDHESVLMAGAARLEMREGVVLSFRRAPATAARPR